MNKHILPWVSREYITSSKHLSILTHWAVDRRRPLATMNITTGRHGGVSLQATMDTSFKGVPPCNGVVVTVYILCLEHIPPYNFALRPVKAFYMAMCELWSRYLETHIQARPLYYVHSVWADLFWICPLWEGDTVLKQPASMARMDCRHIYSSAYSPWSYLRRITHAYLRLRHMRLHKRTYY